MLYAGKAYLSPLVARIIAEQGLGLDVVSGGELMVARRANFPMERVSFHGNNKSADELRLALQMGVGRVVLDNWSELERLTGLARESGQQPGVLIRVAPAVHADTHRYLQTGHAASKFGFPLLDGEAKAAILRVLDEGQLRLLGLHAHRERCCGRCDRIRRRWSAGCYWLARRIARQVGGRGRSAPVVAGLLIPSMPRQRRILACWRRLFSTRWRKASLRLMPHCLRPP